MPWGVLPYYLARGIYRGAKFLGKRVARTVANRAVGRAVGSVGGIVQNALRRRRRARAWRMMKGYRRSAALGLGRTRYLSSLKMPYAYIEWDANKKESHVLRFVPMASETNYGQNQWVKSIFELDDRFRAMCGLYKQWRILNMHVGIRVLAPNFDDSHRALSLFARVIRNCSSNTAFSYFVDPNGVCDVPGCIIKSSRDANNYVNFSINIMPKSILEKSQWYTTDYNSSYNCMDWVNDSEMDFNPALDVQLVGTSSYPSNINQAIQVFYRVSVEFRDAQDAEDAAKAVIVDFDSKDMRTIENSLSAAKQQNQSVLGDTKEIILD